MLKTQDPVCGMQVDEKRAEYKSSAERALPATLASLKFFSENLGPYPYRT